MIKEIYTRLWWHYQVIKSYPTRQRLKREVLRQWEGETLTDEQKEVIQFLKQNTLQTYPYSFAKDYPYSRVKVLRDQSKGVPYVLHHNRKLYFKRGWGNDRIRRAYATLCCEQHPTSPHCYTSLDFEIESGCILADVGSAEGIFALNHIEKAAHVYLFEADNSWLEALEATFAPWSAKVTFVNRFVSDKNTATQITLDSYFSDKTVHFIKADIEGAERSMLAGSTALLQRSEVRQIAITTYHHPDDDKVLWQALEKARFTPRYTHGYMLFTGFGMPEPPYLRRGVIQAQKTFNKLL